MAIAPGVFVQVVLVILICRVEFKDRLKFDRKNLDSQIGLNLFEV